MWAWVVCSLFRGAVVMGGGEGRGAKEGEEQEQEQEEEEKEEENGQLRAVGCNVRGVLGAEW
jgi:hypothetical protein